MTGESDKGFETWTESYSESPESTLRMRATGSDKGTAWAAGRLNGNNHWGVGDWLSSVGGATEPGFTRDFPGQPLDVYTDI